MENYVPILYGSQTGNAESIAEIIHEATEEHGIDSSLHPMNEFDISPEDTCVVFVCSSTGDGELPENARKFVKNLRRKSVSDDHLISLNYALLALGDSNYQTFGGGPKTLEKLLQQKGAKSFYATKIADDATSLEEVVEPWIEGLWPALKKQLFASKEDKNEIQNITNSLQSISVADKLEVTSSNSLKDAVSGVDFNTVTLPPALARYLQLNGVSDHKIDTDETPPFPLQEGEVYKAELQDISQLTRDDALKKTLQVLLKIPENCNYEPGDAFGVIIPNPDIEVNWLIGRLGLENISNDVVKIGILEGTRKKNAKVPTWIHEHTTIRHVLSNCIELRAVPKRTLLRLLVEHTENEDDKNCLKFLCSKIGMGQYNKVVSEPNLNIIDVLAFLPSCKPPIELLIEQLPRLKPRLYSASCSNFLNPGLLKFVFNVIKFPISTFRSYERQGLCSGYFDQLFTSSVSHDLNYRGTEIKIFKSKNASFRLPSNTETPCIFVGPGTGIAPFIGFLEERKHLKSQEIKLGKSWLFYGCRNKDKDFLFKDKIQDFLNDNILKEFKVSFSREGDESVKYVQDNLLLYAIDVAKILLDENGILYVCGDAKNMAKDVDEAIMKIIMKYKNCDCETAQEIIKELVNDKRYKQDVWT